MLKFKKPQAPAPIHFFKGNRPTVWLARGYVMALSIIALLTLLSHELTSKMIEQEIMTGEISYNLSQEITHINQIERYASSYYSSREPLDRTFLVGHLDNLKTAYTEISRYMDKQDSGTMAQNTLIKDMRQEPFLTEPRIKTYIKDADFFLTFDNGSTSPERKAALEKITKNTLQTLIKPIQFALEDFQRQEIEETRQLYSLHSGMSLMIVVVILLEALFIFRPLVDRVQKSQTLLERQALEDPLTELKNRRAFTNDFVAHSEAAIRSKKGYVLAVCDLDKFKSVNDTYGHDVGDLVLKHFSKLLKKTLRPSDVIARMGGEEFVILLTGENARSAHRALERLRMITEKTPCPLKDGICDGNRLKFTTSIGYVEGPINKEGNLEFYLKLADEALYLAKEQGRNLVINGTPPAKTAALSQNKEKQSAASG